MPPSTFTSLTAFPSFDLLPDETIHTGPATNGPWCFAAQITSVTLHSTPSTHELEVTDRIGTEVRIVLSVKYDDDDDDDGNGNDKLEQLGTHRITQFLKPGCTILILHAKQNVLPDGEMGVFVRGEEILPFPIATLQALSERIREANVADAGYRMCFGCGMLQQTVHRCPRCIFFSFCNRECQMTAEFEGHDIECRVLRDRDMERLFAGRWDLLGEFARVYLKPDMGVSGRLLDFI
ncbi:hypothetical protein BJX61DRAFT_544813 [Aspergillus egyptiacus]|nr:hypothetical protein BJX61DRAFT_544813 [Aspergillus egyptiacus]